MMSTTYFQMAQSKTQNVCIEREKAQKHIKMLKTDESDGKFIALVFQFSYVHEKFSRLTWEQFISFLEICNWDLEMLSHSRLATQT